MRPWGWKIDSSSTNSGLIYSLECWKHWRRPLGRSATNAGDLRAALQNLLAAGEALGRGRCVCLGAGPAPAQRGHCTLAAFARSPLVPEPTGKSPCAIAPWCAAIGRRPRCCALACELVGRNAALAGQFGGALARGCRAARARCAGLARDAKATGSAADGLGWRVAAARQSWPGLWRQAPVRVRLQAAWQEAMRPRSGVSPDPAAAQQKLPVTTPATLGRLVFSELADGGGRLVLVCTWRSCHPLARWYCRA